jgi:hypothetical protein
MRIVNRTDFLSLPSGIIYSKYQQLGIIEGLYEKGDTWSDDWIYQSLLDSVDCNDSDEFANIMFAAEEGSEFKMDLNCGERDGVFDDNDKFVVYDKKDLDKLVVRLIGSFNKYPTTN